jgi:hypothetical protein
MRPATKKLSGNLSKILFPKRNFSSVVEIDVPDAVSGRLFEDVSGFYGSHKAKPINKTTALSWKKHLDKVITRENPEFLRTLEEIKRDDGVVILNKIILPEIEASEVPTSNQDLHQKPLSDKLKVSDAIFSAYALSLGIDPDPVSGEDIVGYVFASEAQKNNPSSFQSSQTLKWHNDGWESGSPVGYVALMGLYDNNTKTKTQIISFDQIANYFKDNGKEKLFKALNQYCYIDNPCDDVALFEQAKILDETDKRINFSYQGGFRSRASDNFEEALSFLKESFQNIQPLSIEITPGKIVRIDNLRHVHQRKLETTEPEENVNLVGERAMARITGEKLAPHKDSKTK